MAFVQPTPGSYNDPTHTHLFIRNFHICLHKILKFLNFLGEIRRLKIRKTYKLSKPSKTEMKTLKCNKKTNHDKASKRWQAQGTSLRDNALNDKVD